MIVECRGEELQLLAEKAMYWPRRETLFVADLHLGKAATFRAFGAPVPETATYETLDRLTSLMQGLRPRRLVVLGDLFHAKEGAKGAPLEAFHRFLADHQDSEIKLIVGNHDRRAFAGEDLGDWLDFLDDGPFRFTHHPEDGDTYALCGHIHPGYRLRARGHRAETLPCFWFTHSYAVIPAFGAFTGLAAIEPVSGDRVYVVANSEVIQAR